MKLSKKGEYACLALIDLTQSQAEWTSAKEIANNFQIPLKFLEQILTSLKQGGFVNARTGKQGGYHLARPAKNIALAEVIRYIDGPLAAVGSVSKYFYEPSPVAKHKGLLGVFKDIRDYTAKKMETTTFADLVK